MLNILKIDLCGLFDLIWNGEIRCQPRYYKNRKIETREHQRKDNIFLQEVDEKKNSEKKKIYFHVVIFRLYEN